MPSEIIAIYRTLHTWTGILTGMFLFIAFYAGSIIVFEDEVAQWATPPADAFEAVPLDQANALITATIEQEPASARTFWFALDDRSTEPSGTLSWEVLPEGAGEHDDMGAKHFRATLDGDGHPVVEEEHPSRVAAFINVLHMVVGLPVDNEGTRLFMGGVSLLYFLSLVSGIIYMLPRLVRDLFALRIDDQLRRMWRDAHVVVGLASLPFHLVIALTAAAFALHDPIYAVQNFVVHDGDLRGVFVGPPPEDPTPPDLAALLPPSRLIERVRAEAPGFEVYGLQYVGITTPRASVRVWGHDERGFAFRTLGGFALVDPYTGDLRTTAYLPGHQGAGGTVLSALFAGHFATFGGRVIDWLYVALGLSGAWLFYSGNLLWLEVRRKRLRRGSQGPLPPQRRSTRWMASATVGVCLGAVAGISTLLVSAKGLHLVGLEPDAWHRTVYYVVFFGCIGWSFARGGPRASVELLGFAALTTLAIPLTSLVARLSPSLGLWAHDDLGSLVLEGTALIAAVSFAGLAWFTARRVYSGPRDSVWSARPEPA